MLIIASSYEGYPTVLKESLILKTMCVAFDSPGGVREILRFDNFLAPPKDIDKLVAKINESKSPRSIEAFKRLLAKQTEND